MILLEKSDQNVGRWLQEEVNVIEHYQKAFGRLPPASASLAIMSDSDNTGQSAVSYIGFIEVYR
jgi:hypothetical protein